MAQVLVAAFNGDTYRTAAEAEKDGACTYSYVEETQVEIFRDVMAVCANIVGGEHIQLEVFMLSPPLTLKMNK